MRDGPPTGWPASRAGRWSMARHPYLGEGREGCTGSVIERGDAGPAGSLHNGRPEWYDRSTASGRVAGQPGVPPPCRGGEDGVRTRRYGVGIGLVAAVTVALGAVWSVAAGRHRGALAQVDQDMAAGRYGAARRWLDACLGRRPEAPAVWQAVLDWGLAAERVDGSPPVRRGVSSGDGCRLRRPRR
jgi:hypothetical protein